jgi:hypothetical protein
MLVVTASSAESTIGTKVVSYKSQDGNSQVSLVRYGKKEEQTYLAYYHNLDSDWDGYSILLHKEEGTAKTYYDKLTPGRRIPTVFRSILDIGNKTLINGTIVPEIEVNAKGLGKNIKMYLHSAPLMSPQEILNHYKK